MSFEEAERVRALEEKLARSAEVECAVCLERVLEKPRLGERRFGLLSGCDHSFCLQCIRKTTQCPLCKNPIVGELRPNIPIQRLVAELSTSCPNE